MAAGGADGGAPASAEMFGRVNPSTAAPDSGGGAGKYGLCVAVRALQAGKGGDGDGDVATAAADDASAPGLAAALVAEDVAA